MKFKCSGMPAEQLRSLLHYDPETGIFTRKVKTSPRGLIGTEIAYINKRLGRKQIDIAGYRSYAARFAWLYVHGVWPEGEIDHIDGDKLNDRIVNLRDVPLAVNRQNLRAATRNNRSTGLLGVFLGSTRKNFIARIQINKKTIHLGTFEKAEDAHLAYLDAKRQLHVGCTI